MVPVLINDKTVYEYDELNCTIIYIQTEFFYLYYKAYLGEKITTKQSITSKQLVFI